MIVLSEERFIPVSPGFITLTDSDGVYYYIHRTFYEQAVVIEDRYGENPDALKTLIGGNQDFDCVRKFVQYAPRPVNVMGYFLALLKEDIEDFRDITGALDVIASALNLRKLIKQPESIRQSVCFSLSITEEYQDTWDLFFQNCIPYEQMRQSISGGGSSYSYSVPQQPRQVVQQEDTDIPEIDDPDDFYNPDGSLNQEKYNAYMEKIISSAEEEASAEIAASHAEEDAQQGTSTPAPAPAPVQTSGKSDGGDGLSVIANARRRRALL